MSIEVICGPMFAGKTSRLLYEVKQAVMFGHRRALVVSPDVDDRHPFVSHDGETVSHAGVDRWVVNTKDDPTTAFPSHDRLGRYDVVAFDEAQFFCSTIIGVVRAASTEIGCRVLVAGLDMTYRGAKFGFMGELMVLANTVTKLTATCVACGEPATRTHRKVPGIENIRVGGSDVYEARCVSCWLAAKED
jgi:thymidine kinase